MYGLGFSYLEASYIANVLMVGYILTCKYNFNVIFFHFAAYIGYEIFVIFRANCFMY